MRLLFPYRNEVQESAVKEPLSYPPTAPFLAWTFHPPGHFTVQHGAEAPALKSTIQAGIWKWGQAKKNTRS